MSMEEMGGDITAPPCLPPPWPIKLSNQDSDLQSQEKGLDAKNTAAPATLLLSGSWLLTGRGVPSLLCCLPSAPSPGPRNKGVNWGE